jgi:hypothetical protein
MSPDNFPNIIWKNTGTHIIFHPGLPSLVWILSFTAILQGISLSRAIKWQENSYS